MADPDLTGRRVLVVGASSGIGRGIALAAGRAGACVTVAARRRDRLDEVAAEMGERGCAVACDLLHPDDCGRVVERAVARFGGLDALVYAAGITPLGRLDSTGADAWHAVFTTNVTAACLVTAAALPALAAADDPRAVYLSSVAVGDPWPGLVPYAASKAALEETVRGWRAEHPEVRWSTVVVGPTVTGFADAWDPAEAGAALDRWAAEGRLGDGPPRDADDVGAQIAALLARPDPPPEASTH